MYSKHLQVAKTAAEKAGAFLLEQQNKVKVKEALKDFVTEQEFIRTKYAHSQQDRLTRCSSHAAICEDMVLQR